MKHFLDYNFASLVLTPEVTKEKADGFQCRTRDRKWRLKGSRKLGEREAALETFQCYSQ